MMPEKGASAGTTAPGPIDPGVVDLSFIFRAVDLSFLESTLQAFLQAIFESVLQSFFCSLRRAVFQPGLRTVGYAVFQSVGQAIGQTVFQRFRRGCSGGGFRRIDRCGRTDSGDEHSGCRKCHEFFHNLPPLD